MSAPISTDQVWHEVERAMFAVLGVVTAKAEARTAGIVYAVHDRQLYIASGRSAWKTKHIEKNPNVSLTVAIPKRIPFMPWIRIPAATITFQGEATVHGKDEAPEEIQKELTRGLELDQETLSSFCFIQVKPKGHFVTYGIGVSLPTMRKPEAASGRTPV
jgi:hypothetical protein